MRRDDGGWISDAIIYRPGDDILASLDLVELTLDLILRDKRDHWKWVIVATHNALEGACIALMSKLETDGESIDPSRAMDRNSREKCQKARSRGRVSEKIKFRTLRNLLADLPGSHATRLPESDQQLDQCTYDIRDLYILSEARNIFLHYGLRDWTTEVHPFFNATRTGLHKLESLLPDMPDLAIRDEERKEMILSIERAHEKLDQIQDSLVPFFALRDRIRQERA